MVFEFRGLTRICFSETFAALRSGLQGACGSWVQRRRWSTTCLATHKLKDSKGRDFNERYKEDHYGLKATDSIRGCRAGTPQVEGLCRRWSSGAAPTSSWYEFVRSIVDRRNRLVREKVASEYPHLRALPHAPVPEYASYTARVLKWSHQGGQQDLLGAVAADRRDGRRATVPRPRGGVLQGASR